MIIKSIKYTGNLIALLALLTGVHSYAQVKTFIGLETGPSRIFTRVSDGSSWFDDAGLSTTFNGITLEQELTGNLRIGAGYYFQDVRNGIKITDERPGTPGWDSHSTRMLTVSAKYRIGLPGSNIGITPLLGYIFGMKATDPPSSTRSSIISVPDAGRFIYTITPSAVHRNLHMLETGFTLGYSFPGSWQIGLNLVYAKGFTGQLNTGVTYTDGATLNGTAVYTSYGDFLRTTLDLRVPVSNIWQNRPQRKQSRLEKSYSGGGTVKKNREIYVGGEAGPVWRLFQYSNPAIAPKPLENRGVFRYASFRTGAYAGLMLNEYLGLDAGVYYQGSSTFFAVMYDHEADFTEKTDAPMFLEVPLKLRYYYPLLLNELDLVVYAGTSLLTHFAPADYGTGSGSFTYDSPVSGPEQNGSVTYTASRTSRFGGILKAGAGLEYILPVPFPLKATFYADYTHGYVKIDELALTTNIPGEAPEVSTISSFGSGWHFSLGVKVPFIISPKGTSRCGRLPRTRIDN